MSRTCSVTICLNPTSGYSTLCELHKRNLRRHGHAEQTGVTVHELQPYEEAIQARRIKNPGNPTWALLQARWEAVTTHAEAMLNGSHGAGSVGVSYERQTAEQVVVLRGHVAGVTLENTALAMILFGERRPTRFRSDKAFSFQLSRRVRGLARINAGHTLDAKTGRVKRTYRDTPPRVMESLASTLKLVFGVAGLRLAELDEMETHGHEAERQQLHDALKDMQ